MQDIRDFTLDNLEGVISGMGQPLYRARQIFSWLYRSNISGFDQMSNIPQTLKSKLAEKYYLYSPRVSQRLKSIDATEKILFQLKDGKFVEAVLIPAIRRKTICLSTQVGCKFRCVFCASGQKGFSRNLTPAEIVSQALYFKHDLNQKITNYVFMGMGEPLDNYQNLVKSIEILNNPNGMNIGARRITISTCGIVPGIEKLSRMKRQINLSVSLHAVNDRLRDKLMPVNRRYPLADLIKACQDYRVKTNRMVTLEYVLAKGVNDSQDDVKGLASIAKRLKAKVNLIPYSPVSGVGFNSPTDKEVKNFGKNLVGKGVNATIRESKGRDILGGCGQLAGRVAE